MREAHAYRGAARASRSSTSTTSRWSTTARATGPATPCCATLTAGWAAAAAPGRPARPLRRREFVLCLPGDRRATAPGTSSAAARRERTLRRSAGVARPDRGRHATRPPARPRPRSSGDRPARWLARWPPGLSRLSYCWAASRASSRRLTRALGVVDAPLRSRRSGTGRTTCGRRRGRCRRPRCRVDLVEAGDGRAHGDLLAVGVCDRTLGRRYDGSWAPRSSADADPSRLSPPAPSVATHPRGRRKAHAMTGSTTLTRERADLLESLRRHRDFLRFTVRGSPTSRPRQRPTVSALDPRRPDQARRRRPRRPGCGSPRAAPRR